MIATGITAAGGREILGVDIGHSEDASVPKGQSEVVAAAFRSIFALVVPTEILTCWDEVGTCSNPSSRNLLS